MQFMPSLKNNLIQVIWWLTIFAGSHPLLKKLINRFHHRFANLNRLKRRQLWFNPCLYWPTHKNDLLQASQSHYQYPRPSRSHYQCSNKASWPSRLNRHQLEVFFYHKVLVIAMLFSRYQAETLHRLLPINK